MGQDSFILHSNYTPSGDQPEANAKLIDGINNGASHQTLKESRVLAKPLLFQMSYIV